MKKCQKVEPTSSIYFRCWYWADVGMPEGPRQGWGSCGRCSKHHPHHLGERCKLPNRMRRRPRLKLIWERSHPVDDEVLACLSVWTCIWSSWCHYHPIISCSSKIQNGLPLVPAYQAVLAKTPLSGCSSSSSSSPCRSHILKTSFGQFGKLVMLVQFLPEILWVFKHPLATTLTGVAVALQTLNCDWLLPKATLCLKKVRPGNKPAFDCPVLE